MPWYDYWTELDLDDNPISYKDVEFEQAIVQTNAVKELNEIVKTISKRRQICWILGRRGTGKSQMLHWTIRQLFMNLDKSNSPPIMVTVLGKKKPTELFDTLLREVCRRFVRFSEEAKQMSDVLHQTKLADSPSQFLKKVKKLDFDAELKKIEAFEKPEEVFDYLVSALRLWKEKGIQKVVVVIDELDKQPVETILELLGTHQAFFEKLREFGCVFFISTDISWYEQILLHERYNFYKGSEVRIPIITNPDDINRIIRNRLLREGYLGELPFKNEGLEALAEISRGVCRDIIRYSSRLLNTAAKKKVETIGRGFVRSTLLKYDSAIRNAIINFLETHPSIEYDLRQITEDPRRVQVLDIFYDHPNLMKRPTVDTRRNLGLELSNREFDEAVADLHKIGSLERHGSYYKVSQEMNAFLTHLKELEVPLPKVVELLPAFGLPDSKPQIEYFELIEKIILHKPYLSAEEIQKEIRKSPDAHSRYSLKNLGLQLDRLLDEGKIIKIRINGVEKFRTPSTHLSQADMNHLASELIIDELEWLSEELVKTEPDSTRIKKKTNRILVEAINQVLKARELQTINRISKKTIKQTLEKLDLEDIQNEVNEFLEYHSQKQLEPSDARLLLAYLRKIVDRLCTLRIEQEKFQKQKQQLISIFERNYQASKLPDDNPILMTGTLNYPSSFLALWREAEGGSQYLMKKPKHIQSDYWQMLEDKTVEKVSKIICEPCDTSFIIHQTRQVEGEDFGVHCCKDGKERPFIVESLWRLTKPEDIRFQIVRNFSEVIKRFADWSKPFIQNKIDNKEYDLLFLIGTKAFAIRFHANLTQQLITSFRRDLDSDNNIHQGFLFYSASISKYSKPKEIVELIQLNPKLLSNLDSQLVEVLQDYIEDSKAIESIDKYRFPLRVTQALKRAQKKKDSKDFEGAIMECVRIIELELHLYAETVLRISYKEGWIEKSKEFSIKGVPLWEYTVGALLDLLRTKDLLKEVRKKKIPGIPHPLLDKKATNWLEIVSNIRPVGAHKTVRSRNLQVEADNSIMATRAFFNEYYKTQKPYLFWFLSRIEGGGLRCIDQYGDHFEFPPEDLPADLSEGIIAGFITINFGEHMMPLVKICKECEEDYPMKAKRCKCGQILEDIDGMIRKGFRARV